MDIKNVVQHGLTATLAFIPALSLAAQPLNLQHQSTAVLQTLVTPTKTAATAPHTAFVETERAIDFNQVLHIRSQQTVSGYPVLGGDFVIHVPKQDQPLIEKNLAGISAAKHTTMNGIVYQNLAADLPTLPEQATAQKTMDFLVNSYQKTAKSKTISDKKIKLMAYVDKNHKAHWVYFASFRAEAMNALTEKPTYVVDASSMQIYQAWNDTQTLEIVQAGGFGGNRKTAMKTYDGETTANHAASFTVTRDAETKTCYLRDDVAMVRDARYEFDVVKFSCPTKVSQHHNLYWNGGIGSDPDFEEFTNPDAANGGFSPSNDGYYAAHVIKAMYQDWYGVEPIRDIYTKKPIKIIMFSHSGKFMNAQWDIDHMVLYDGEDDETYPDRVSYPLTGLDVIAHEVSHGFTLNHSVLLYFAQSGGMNEAFSDMAAQAAEYYMTQNNDWLIGANVFKKKDRALRYMNNPMEDCDAGKIPAESCSIDNLRNYNDKINVHFSSGIYNKAFYLISTAPDWNVKKAFDVMVHANMFYWTSMSTFHDGACGVLLATKDYSYDTNVVAKAFAEVGITTADC